MFDALKTLSDRQPEAAARTMAEHIKDSIEWYAPETSTPRAESTDRLRKSPPGQGEIGKISVNTSIQFTK